MSTSREKDLKKMSLIQLQNLKKEWLDREREAYAIRQNARQEFEKSRQVYDHASKLYVEMMNQYDLAMREINKEIQARDEVNPLRKLFR